jgi:hypothetical protein
MARFPVGVCVAAAAVFGAQAVAQRAGQALRAVTAPEGTFLASQTGPALKRGPMGGMDSILWTFSDPISIPQSGAIGAPASAWIGEALNTERLQRFALGGNGTPLAEFPGTHATFNPAASAAARAEDLAVFMDQAGQGGVLTVRAYISAMSSGSPPLWTFDFPASFNSSDVHNIKVSRNGRVVACVANDGAVNACVAYFLDGATGGRLGVWNGTNGTCTGIDLTDDGSRALVCHVTTARLIDTSTGGEVYSAVGSGAGGRYNISGDGSVLVVGGFSLQVYKRVNGNYQTAINFSAPTSWFAWASAVSRDGSTVGVLSHDYASNYLNTATRIWDVNSGQLLGSHFNNGSGQYQDSAWGAAMSEHGDRLVVCSWGDQAHSHPAVLVFDRQANVVGSLDPTGSPWAVDITDGGRTVLATNKSVHANVFGNGGSVTLFAETTATCYANCDGSTQPPVLNVNDFVCFQTRFAAADPYADCNHDSTLNVNDFVCFQTEFAAGCL